MTDSSQKKIGLMGGSYNPVHNGHVSIARSFIQSGAIHELWVFPTPVSPFKQSDAQREELLSVERRLNMLRCSFEGQSGVKVKDLESELNPPYYTLHTVEYLQSLYPDIDFFLCIGEDSVTQIHHWHKAKELLDKVKLLVAARPGSDTSLIDRSVVENTTFIDHNPMDVSSSDIREKVRAGEPVAKLIPECVRTQIKQLNLYSDA